MNFSSCPGKVSVAATIELFLFKKIYLFSFEVIVKITKSLLFLGNSYVIHSETGKIKLKSARVKMQAFK